MGRPGYVDYNVLNTVFLMLSMLGCYSEVHNNIMYSLWYANYVVRSLQYLHVHNNNIIIQHYSNVCCIITTVHVYMYIHIPILYAVQFNSVLVSMHDVIFHNLTHTLRQKLMSQQSWTARCPLDPLLWWNWNETRHWNGSQEWMEWGPVRLRPLGMPICSRVATWLRCTGWTWSREAGRDLAYHHQYNDQPGVKD